MPNFDIDFEAINFLWVAIIAPASIVVVTKLKTYIRNRRSRLVRSIVKQALRPYRPGDDPKYDDSNDDDLIKLIIEIVDTHNSSAEGTKKADSHFHNNLKSASAKVHIHKLFDERVGVPLADQIIRLKEENKAVVAAVEKRHSDKLKELQNDFYKVSQQLSEFIKNYYSRLESFLLQSTKSGD